MSLLLDDVIPLLSKVFFLVMRDQRYWENISFSLASISVISAWTNNYCLLWDHNLQTYNSDLLTNVMPHYLQLYTPITLLDKSLGEIKKLKPWVLSIILLSLVSSHSFLMHLKMKPKDRLVASSSWVLALLSSILGREIDTHSSDSTHIILFRHLEQGDCDMRVDHSLYAQIAWHRSLDPHNWMLFWVILYSHWLAKGHHFKHILEYVWRDVNIIGEVFQPP